MSKKHNGFFKMGSVGGGDIKEGKGYKPIPKCYVSHPVLQLGGGTFYGGSCSSPVSGCDVYVGLDYSMHRMAPQYPWNPPVVNAPIEVHYKITDMAAPSDPAEFWELINWLLGQLALGKKVHVGCIGGHGRTGTVLAALYAHITGEKDVIQWVRKNYCERAVESTSQIKFLMKYFGASSAPESKPAHYGMISASGRSNSYGGYSSPDRYPYNEPISPLKEVPRSATMTATHIRTKARIWD